MEVIILYHMEDTLGYHSIHGSEFFSNTHHFLNQCIHNLHAKKHAYD